MTATTSPEQTMRALARGIPGDRRESVVRHRDVRAAAGVERAAQTKLIEGTMLGVHVPGLGHWWDGAAEVRGKVGQFIGCDPADVALLRSTGEGISLVSLGLDWHPGDEVVLYDQEFPSGVYPFLALEKKGVSVVFVRDRGRHRFDVADVADAMSDRTRVVCISLVNCYHGFRAPVEQSARARIAGAGCSWTPSRRWECCPSRSRRWEPTWSPRTATRACARATASVSATCRQPCGRAWTSWRRAGRTSRTPRSSPGNSTTTCDTPTAPGGSSRPCRTSPHVRARREHRSVHGSGTGSDRRVGTRPQPRPHPRTHGEGYRVVSSDRPGEMSGIISVEAPGGDAATVRAALAGQKIRCAVRDGRLRFACHLFNNREDIERLIAALPPP